jgi:hypothetical protein
MLQIGCKNSHNQAVRKYYIFMLKLLRMLGIMISLKLNFQAPFDTGSLKPLLSDDDEGIGDLEA